MSVRAAIGGIVYGCDVCRRSALGTSDSRGTLREDAFRPRGAIAGKNALTLAREILAMDDETFRNAFRGSPMKRAKLRGLKRNAAVVSGNADGDSQRHLRAATSASP